MKKNAFLLMLLTLSSIISVNAQNKYYFEQVTVADGMSQNNITCIYQDKQGFMWFGTTNGLNKYNGYEIEEFYSKTNETNSLCDNSISALFCDSYQQLWVGTSNGLCKYNPQSNDFEQVHLQNNSKGTSENQHILSFYEDKNHVLWIGTAGGLLYAYNLKDGQLETYPSLPHYASIRIITTFKDSLIVGCSNNQGVFHLDKKKKRFFKTKTDALYNGKSISSFSKGTKGQLWMSTFDKSLIEYGKAIKSNFTLGNIQSICSYSDSQLIIATENNGLHEYNIRTGKIVHISSQEQESNLNSKAVTCLYADLSQILWVGTTNGGINKFDPNKNNFKYLSLHFENTPRQSVHSVLALCKQKDNTLLIGLDNKGIYCYDPHTANTSTHTIATRFSELKSSPINAVLCDSRSFTWIGTYCRSMKVVGPDPEQRHINQLIKKNLPSTSSIKHILEDSKHNIWIATSQGIILRYIPEKRSMEKFDRSINLKVNPNVILSLYEDSQKRIWAGSMCGLYCYDEKRKDFIQVYLPDAKNYSYAKNTIIPICETDKNTLWLGTQDGLLRYDLCNKRTKRYASNNGLSSNSIKGLLYDKNTQHLWISTDKGLSSFNLKDGKITNFGLEDGITNREFNYMSFLNDGEGNFYFGSINGIYHFRPKLIARNVHAPKVVITHCQFYENNWQEQKKQVINYNPLIEKTLIEIPYSKSTFSIHYVALNYTNSSKNEYAYRLKNYDNNWHYVEGQRIATFTNLDPGTYQFQVVASNNDGVWNKIGSSITIIILPPWWRSAWAYIIYAILISSLLYASLRFYTNRIKMKSQLAREQFERKQLEKLNQLKMQFFSNITHEFRTPLTLILSPLDSLVKQKVGKSMQNEYLRIIQNNAIKLLELVNELLDFSKTGAGSFIFKPTNIRLNSILKQELQTFQPLAESKSIEMKFIDYDKSINCRADASILQKIVSNLLSNAIKHTPEKGSIDLYLIKKEGTNPCLEISVEDSGKGIPKEEQELIFKRFYQMKEDSNNGTGIGLTLVKNLTELHNGTIRLESTPGRGSKFTLTIPFVKPSENVVEQAPIKDDFQIPMPSSANQQIAQIEEELFIKEEENKNYTVLIAEDNEELRSYIASLLTNRYNILTAKNGKIALEIAQKELPDIIISDILMPEMDGKEFCTRIKKDIHTCHIPFIILTALTSESYQIEGLTTGADDYLTKPFNPSILLYKVNNILQSRKLISRRSDTMQALQPEQHLTEDKDREFLLQLISIIKANMANSKLKIDDLGRELGMSHTPFYKKIKELTSQTPNDFLKQIRLEQARKLLCESKLSVSEVAYQTGFSSPKYFQECFKKHFGENPREYQMH